MSGGSLDYVSFRVEEAAATIRARCPDPLHQAFATHLELVANALHECEWVLSCDTGPGDDEAAIRAVVSPEMEMAAAVAKAAIAASDLDHLLAKARALTPESENDAD